LLRAFHNFQDTARGYSLTQLLGGPTIRRYQAFVRAHVPRDPAERVLEIGCGIGSARPWFAENYTGIDINPEYVARAQKNFSGDFRVMDAGQMTFSPGEFDDAVSIATAHHLTDKQLAAMVKSATAAAATLHVIDAILPISSASWFKTALFRMDRGRYVRTFGQLRSRVARDATVEFSEVAEGPLHDVCYIRASRNA
jgi:cyclopropane fatty-acyl-phospholipid synthase-like methyltransferase